MFPRLLVVLVLGLAACGGTPARPSGGDTSPPGDIPDNQAFVTYAPPGARFSVKVPEGWSQTTHGRDFLFTDKLNSFELAWDAAPAPPPAGAKVSTVTRKAGIVRFTTHLPP